MGRWNRRRICRGLFLLLALFPALATGMYAVYHQRFLHQSEETWVAHVLGLHITADRWTHPAPGILQVQGLALYDLETNRPIAQVDELRVQRRRHALIITSHHVHLPAGQWLAVIDHLQEHFLRRESRLPSHVRWQIDRLSIARETEPHPVSPTLLTDVTCEINRPADGPALVAQFWPTDSRTGEPIQLRVARHPRAHGGPATLHVSTHDHRLPCWLLASPVPSWQARLGTATFRGTLWLERNADGWDATCAGDFAQLPLPSLLQDWLPYELTGQAQIHLHEARVRRGIVELASGVFSAGPGTVSESLCAGIGRELRGRVPPAAAEASHAAGPIRYTEFAGRFRLDPDGLVLVGDCRSTHHDAHEGNNMPSGTLIACDHVALVNLSEQPVGWAQVLRFLDPHDTPSIPASRTSIWVSSRLPLPQIHRPTRRE